MSSMAHISVVSGVSGVGGVVRRGPCGHEILNRVEQAATASSFSILLLCWVAGCFGDASLARGCSHGAIARSLALRGALRGELILRRLLMVPSA